MMAYIAKNLKDWIHETHDYNSSLKKEVKIILRFIGISKESNSIQNISFSIIKELKEEYGIEYDQEKVSAKYLFEYLTNVAKKFPNTMFYLLLDSLDQLLDENDAKN